MRRVLVAILLLGVTVQPVDARSAEAKRRKCFRRAVTIKGTAEGDFITGTPRRDVIVAGKGDDVVFADRGRDRICGGRGDDLLVGGDGRDRARGAKGVDSCDAEIEYGCEL